MNQENKKQVILAAILGVVLVGVLIYQFLIAGGPTTPTTTASASGGTTPAKTAPAGKAPEAAPAARLKKVDVDLDKLLNSIKVVTFRYDMERISRNPMTPLVGRVFTAEGRGPAPTSAVTDLNIRQKSVTGIIYSEFNPVAIVDDEVVTEGHQYADGVAIIRIEPKRVWFEWNGTQIPVDLKEL
jgi:hypothetical protein